MTTRIEEFAYETGKPVCDWMDHTLTWCGDCYACVECGLKHVSVRQATAEVTAERKRIAAQLSEMRTMFPQAFDFGMAVSSWAIREFIEELEKENDGV